MLSRPLLNRIIILSFMMLIGFALAMAIFYKSFMGITLALVSLGASIYFMHLLAKARREIEEAEEMY